MRVLIACEYSAVERTAFEAKGYDVTSCDLLDTEKPGKHYKGNVFDIIDQGWDMMIAHPPCTYLCNSGVRWLYNKDGSVNQDRYEKMFHAAQFFNELLRAPIKHIAIENPIMHKHAKALITHTHTQVIQPYQFGHGETKATCLWLKNLPKLTYTDVVAGRVHRIHTMKPGKERSKERSRSYPGIAAAMADQWP